MEGNYLSVIAPRVLLLQVLNENVAKLHSEIGQKKWGSFCSGMVAALEATRDELLRGLPDDSELKKVVKHVFEKKYNVVRLGEEISEHYAKTKDSGAEAAALADVKTALALFVQAMDKHVLEFLHANPYEGSLLALLSGSDLPRSWASTWAKFLETYNPMVMPAGQQFRFLAAGLVLNQSLITRMHAAPTRVPTTTSSLTEDHVFFVTDRVKATPFEATNSRVKVGGSLQDLKYGVVKVGFVEGTIPTPIDQVIYISSELLGNDYTSFIQRLNSHLALLDAEAGNSSPSADVLIFIHGYMTQFGEGDIRRASQIKHDMNLFGTAIAYSWSSQGTELGYWDDEEEVAATTPYLASFLKLCITQVKARRLHVLAHSMGNRAMIGALRQIYAEITSGGDSEWIQTGLPLKNVISAAADWTMSEFQGMVQEAKQIFGEGNTSSEHRPHFSVYSSMDDTALMLSNALHPEEGIRLGLTNAHFEDDSVTLSEPPETGFIDVIDATGYADSIHMYFAFEADVLLDMQQLISVPGKERAYLRAASSDGTQRISNVKYQTTDKEFDFYSFSPETWP